MSRTYIVAVILSVGIWRILSDPVAWIINQWSGNTFALTPNLSTYWPTLRTWRRTMYPDSCPSLWDLLSWFCPDWLLRPAFPILRLPPPCQLRRRWPRVTRRVIASSLTRRYVLANLEIMLHRENRWRFCNMLLICNTVWRSGDCTG